MGFGYVFIGYLFMYSFPYKGIDVLPDIIGFIIAYIGVRNLSDYGCGWDNLKRFFGILLPASSITLVTQVLKATTEGLLVYDIWAYFYTAVLLVYNVMLLVAVYHIADDTEVLSIKAKAQRNLVLGIIYYAIMLVVNIPHHTVQSLNAYISTKLPLGLILFLFGYIWQFLNLAVIFSCYMWICQIGDEDMPYQEKKLFKKKKEEDEL